MIFAAASDIEINSSWHSSLRTSRIHFSLSQERASQAPMRTPASGPTAVQRLFRRPTIHIFSPLDAAPEYIRIKVSPKMKSQKSTECRSGDHANCDGTVPRGFDELHDQECLCECHDSRVEREFFSEHRKPGRPKTTHKSNDL